jgi:hypothetical protein
MKALSLFILGVAFITCTASIAGSRAAESATSSSTHAPDTTIAPVLRAVVTYESIGLYLPGAAAPTTDTDNDAKVEYRVNGAATWSLGLPLWYDVRNSEYRGSLVRMKPGATYDIRVTLDSGEVYEAQATTWSDTYPVARTVTVPEFSDTPLVITEGGSPAGYVVYEPAAGRSATIDVARNHDFNVIVKAKYVIVRGLTLKGARHSGILLGSTPEPNAEDVTDVVIEDNDVSGWGSWAKNDPACEAKHKTTEVYGVNFQAGVYSRSTLLERVTIQRNKLHHPHSGSNTWKQHNCSSGGTFHPLGPQGISIFKSKGRLVIRYNEIYSKPGHYFNDGMGESANFSDNGFPNMDSDIYGNYIRNTWDDGIEAEGANKNVRIWGNYIDQTYTKVAIASTFRGPIYIFRNVTAVSKTGDGYNYGQIWLKTRNTDGFGGGRSYVFNNTLLMPTDGPPSSTFISEFDEPNKLTSIRAYNNLIQIDGKRPAIYEEFGTTNRFDYNMANVDSTFNNPAVQQRHGLKAWPVFNDGVLNLETLRGDFSLSAGSPGYDSGMAIPNFTDGHEGAAPDIGAQESGSPPMEFGVDAYR